MPPVFSLDSNLPVYDVLVLTSMPPEGPLRYGETIYGDDANFFSQPQRVLDNVEIKLRRAEDEVVEGAGISGWIILFPSQYDVRDPSAPPSVRGLRLRRPHPVRSNVDYSVSDCDSVVSRVVDAIEPLEPCEILDQRANRIDALLLFFGKDDRGRMAEFVLECWKRETHHSLSAVILPMMSVTYYPSQLRQTIWRSLDHTDSACARCLLSNRNDILFIKGGAWPTRLPCVVCSTEVAAVLLADLARIAPDVQLRDLLTRQLGTGSVRVDVECASAAPPPLGDDSEGPINGREEGECDTTTEGRRHRSDPEYYYSEKVGGRALSPTRPPAPSGRKKGGVEQQRRRQSATPQPEIRLRHRQIMQLKSALTKLYADNAKFNRRVAVPAAFYDPMRRGCAQCTGPTLVYLCMICGHLGCLAHSLEHARRTEHLRYRDLTVPTEAKRPTAVIVNKTKSRMESSILPKPTEPIRRLRLLLTDRDPGLSQTSLSPSLLTAVENDSRGALLQLSTTQVGLDRISPVDVYTAMVGLEAALMNRLQECHWVRRLPLANAQRKFDGKVQDMCKRFERQVRELQANSDTWLRLRNSLDERHTEYVSVVKEIERDRTQYAVTWCSNRQLMKQISANAVDAATISPLAWSDRSKEEQEESLKLAEAEGVELDVRNLAERIDACKEAKSLLEAEIEKYKGELTDQNWLDLISIYDADRSGVAVDATLIEANLVEARFRWRGERPDYPFSFPIEELNPTATAQFLLERELLGQYIPPESPHISPEAPS